MVILKYNPSFDAKEGSSILDYDHIYPEVPDEGVIKSIEEFLTAKGLQYQNQGFKGYKHSWVDLEKMPHETLRKIRENFSERVKRMEDYSKWLNDKLELFESLTKEGENVE